MVTVEEMHYISSAFLSLSPCLAVSSRFLCDESSSARMWILALQPRYSAMLERLSIRFRDYLTDPLVVLGNSLAMFLVQTGSSFRFLNRLTPRLTRSGNG